MASVYEELSALINRFDVFNEIECGGYLIHAAPFLVPVTSDNISTEREDRNYFGSSDFIVCGTFVGDQMNETRCAYIWELKAPQCFLFERDDNKNRFRPTLDYLKAENQLLHYYRQAIYDDGFRRRFKVMDTREIRIGGIIIGRSDRMARNVEPRDEVNIAIAQRVRKEYLYKTQNIRVLTWDKILSYLRPAR